MQTKDDINLLDGQKLIRGCYEAERLPDDLSSVSYVPDFAYNALNPLGLLYRPIVDEKYLAGGSPKPVWPGGRPFAVCLTHDVDVVSLYSFRQISRIRTRNFMADNSLAIKARSLVGWGIDALRAAIEINAKDPLHCYERWLEVEKQVGARSTFFFWPGWSAIGRHHHSDCAYELSDRIVFDRQKCTVIEMIREISRKGWEIGLHPSWYSFDDVDEMKRQKEALENILEKDVVSVRQHFLHYDIRVTPKIQADAGFKYDSTLGFNDNIGFRLGTSYPWRLYDLKTETQLSITEIPLIIQDGALLLKTKGLRLDAETAFQYIVQIAQEVKNVGGVLTVLWHPQYIINADWWNLYRRMLNYLQEQDALFCSVEEAGSFWLHGNDSA